MMSSNFMNPKNVYSSMMQNEVFPNNYPTSENTLRRSMFHNIELHSEKNLFSGKVRDFITSYKKATHTPIDIIDAVTHLVILYCSGLCLSVNKENMKCIVLNHSNKEEIKSIVYNKVEDSIVFIINDESIHGSTTCNIRILMVKRLIDGNIFDVRYLFQNPENIPSLIKFDDINNRLFSKHTIKSQQYPEDESENEEILRIIDLRNWNQIREIKVTDSFLVSQCNEWFLVTYLRPTIISFEIYASMDGQHLKTINYRDRSSSYKNIEFILPFSSLILIKKRYHPLLLLDIKTEETTTIPLNLIKLKSSFLLPIRFDTFISIHQQTTYVWNTSGKLVNKYHSEDNPHQPKKTSTFQTLSENECIAYKIKNNKIFLRELFSGYDLGTVSPPSGRENRNYFEVMVHNLTMNEIYSANSDGSLFIWK